MKKAIRANKRVSDVAGYKINYKISCFYLLPMDKPK